MDEGATRIGLEYTDASDYSRPLIEPQIAWQSVPQQRSEGCISSRFVLCDRNRPAIRELLRHTADAARDLPR